MPAPEPAPPATLATRLEDLGAVVPLALRRAGADPATASSIFLTTATDVVSMGLFLALATWLIL